MPDAAPVLPELQADARVSVIVPVRNGAATLEACVGAVLAQEPAPAEVILAVGPSEDGSAELARELAARDPRIRVVDNRSGRTPDGLNEAIAASTGQVIARVDAHALLPPGYLARAVSTLRETGAGNVGGVQVPVGRHGFDRAVALAMRSPFGTGGAAYRGGGPPRPADTVYLGVFHRAALDEVGGFDTRFTRNQDAELNERLRAAGFVVWLDPSLRVDYQPRRTVQGLASQYWQYGRWRRLTARTHPGSLRARQLAPPALVVALIVAAVTAIMLARWWPFAVALGLYLVVLVGAAAAAAPRARMVLTVALSLATMHLSWGVGFLVGPPRGRGAPSSSRPSHD